jgi:hypothetical protein
MTLLSPYNSALKHYLRAIRWTRNGHYVPPNVQERVLELVGYERPAIAAFVQAVMTDSIPQVHLWQAGRHFWTARGRLFVSSERES